MTNVYNDNYLLNLSVKYIAPLIAKHLPPPAKDKPQQSLIDVGCGNGSVLNYLKVHYGDSFAYTGIDLFKNEQEGIRFLQADLNQNFAKELGPYDVVLSCEVLEHVVDTDHFINEIKKLLSDQGLLILTTPNLGSFLNRLLLAFGFQPLHTEVSWVSPYLGREVLYKIGHIAKSPAAGHLRLFTHRALRAFLVYHGFEVVAVDSFVPYEGSMKIISKLFSFFPALMPGMFFVARKCV
ncbi:MAG: hypothetical protein ACD_62C00428G0006 [uncultured bacterium]|nr:MAG: hypothetical protein ACD_62C00428G0006 [uncultured bacterium]